MPPTRLPAPQTEAGAGWSNKLRRLGDFSVCDEAGIAEPLESIDYAQKKLFLSGECLPCVEEVAVVLGGRRCMGGRPSWRLAGRWRATTTTRPSCPLTTCHSSLSLPCPALPLPAGVVYPKDGPTNKETGRRLDKFGPLDSFSLDFSDKKEVKVRALCTLGASWVHASAFAASVARSAMCAQCLQGCPRHKWRVCCNAAPRRHALLQIVAATKEGQYVLTRPAAAYKKVFAPLAEKAAIVFEASGQLGCSTACMTGQCRNVHHSLPAAK